MIMDIGVVLSGIPLGYMAWKILQLKDINKALTEECETYARYIQELLINDITKRNEP